MKSDVCDILGVAARDDGGINKAQKRSYQPRTPKRPSNVSREVWGLLPFSNKISSAIADGTVPSSSKLYCSKKAELGTCDKVRRWIWTPFKIKARCDDLELWHWRREDQSENPLYTSDLPSKPDFPRLTDEEYRHEILSANTKWTEEDTKYLIEMCERFNLKFIIVADRWDDSKHGVRSVEDIKERYYELCAFYDKIHNSGSGLSIYDAESERRRKLQAEQIYSRSKEQAEEERCLLAEWRKIEDRKRLRNDHAIRLCQEVRSREKEFSIDEFRERIITKRTDANSALMKVMASPGPILASQQMAALKTIGPKRMNLLMDSLRRVGINQLPENEYSNKIVCAMYKLASEIIDLYNTKMASLEYEEQLCTILRAMPSKNDPIEDGVLEPLNPSMISYKMELPSSKTQAMAAPAEKRRRTSRRH